jgi:hypothetical protein
MLATEHRALRSTMQIISLESFPSDEREDFISSCKRWRRDPDDFVVTAEEPDSPGSPPGPVRREVIVTHIPSGKARRYAAGHGSNWNLSFGEDLQALYFTRT